MTSKFLLMALATCATFCAWSQTNTNETALSTTASLRDGSKIKGLLLTRSFKGEALFDKALELSADYVKSISMSGTNGAAKVSLTNGDTLSLTLTTPSVEIDSTLGRLSIAHAKLNSLTIAKTSMSAGDGSGLVFHCTFDDESSVTSPTVGPSGRFLNGRFVPGKNGNGLYIPPYTSCAAFDLPAGFFGKAGCIEMWFKIENKSSQIGAGGDPRLFSAFESSNRSHPIFNIDFVNNDGGGNSGVSTYSIMGHTASISGYGYNLSYQQLLGKGDWRDWHHIALVWNADGISNHDKSSKIALYIDGEETPTPIATGRGAMTIPRLITSGYRLGIPYDPDQQSEFNSKSPFVIDEFKIWNYAKTDFSL